MLGSYLQATSSRLILMTVAFFFVVTNAPSKICELLLVHESENVSANATSMLNSVSGLALSLLNLVALLIFMITTITYVLDIAYISLPFSRVMLSGRKKKFVSYEAIKATEICMGDTVTYKKVKDYNRIQRNKVWLETMLGVLDKEEGLDAFGLRRELKVLSDSIKFMEESGKKGKSYYLSMSKIEFLHDKYLQIIKQK